MSEGLVYDWINETRKFQPRYAQVLALLYNVSETWVMTGEGEMFNPQGPRIPGMGHPGEILGESAENPPGSAAKSVYWRALLDEARRERDAWRHQARALTEILQRQPAELELTESAESSLVLDSRPLNAEESALIRAWRNLTDAGMRHALLGTIRGEARAGVLAPEQTGAPHHQESRIDGKGK
ncbi:MAG: hypothetical protein OEW39_14560 [Deltaproteobacteria bacterium]|nr:hypothetical protein [Deltaproteobacteria bacterium]